MVSKYNEAAQSSGLTTQQAHAVVGNLFEENVASHLNSPEFQNFDIAVIGLGFHHFEDPALALKRLTERLKPETGTLLIIDFLPFRNEREMEAEHRARNPDSASDMPDMSATIKHDGFTYENMKKPFDDAGLEEFGWSVLPEPAVMEIRGVTRERTIFIARGRKPPTAFGKFRNWVGGMQDAIGGQMKY